MDPGAASCVMILRLVPNAQMARRHRSETVGCESSRGDEPARGRLLADCFGQALAGGALYLLQAPALDSPGAVFPPPSPHPIQTLLLRVVHWRQYPVALSIVRIRFGVRVRLRFPFLIFTPGVVGAIRLVLLPTVNQRRFVLRFFEQLAGFLRRAHDFGL